MTGPAVILGCGAVGGWVADVVLRSSEKVRVDRDHGDIRADITKPTTRAVAAVKQASSVVLSLPQSPGLKALSWVAEIVGDTTPLVTTASVQAPFFDALERHPRRESLVGFVPMFNPELVTGGRPLAVVAEPGTRPASVEQAVQWAESAGTTPTRLTPGEHAQAVELLQVLPHAASLGVAGVLASSGADITKLWRIATPPARLHIAVLARILGGVRDVYGDIQASESASRVRQELSGVIEGIDGSDFGAFVAMLDRWETDVGVDALADLQKFAHELLNAATAVDDPTQFTRRNYE